MMTDGLQEIDLEHFAEKDDLVKLLQELHNRKGVLEQALALWKEKHSDIINWERDFDLSSLQLPFVKEATEMRFSSDDCSETLSDKITPSESQLRRRRQRRESADLVEKDDNNLLSQENRNNSWCYDQYMVPDSMKDTEDTYDGSYFEVTPLSGAENKHEEQKSSMQALLQRLKETKERVSVKCDQFDKTISDISNAVSESLSLRERIGMTHRSMTLIEMKQEKVMREALYENVTAKCTIRRLQEEVIQLRIREAQHQSDIQRLMSENNRLKLRVMETKARASFVKKPPQAIPESCQKEAVGVGLKDCSVSPIAAGLHEINTLKKPVCEGAVQRGCLSLYKEQTFEKSGCTSRNSTYSDVNYEKKCPLCNRVPNEADHDLWRVEKATRTVGTSTADIENIIAPRTSVVVMGMILPIPLFLACLLRTIEESMAMIGRICFAELPPFDPSFPELQGDVMDALSQMYDRVKQNIR